jgi:serine/threonine protein kinase
MDLMEKKDLAKVLPELSLQTRFQMAQDLARGLNYCHEQGVVHGDIKPANILVNNFNQGKWTDFGLSRTRQKSIATMQDTSQEARWQAPESWQIRAEISPASDIYSFGMLLWSLLTGRLPYANLSDDTRIIARVQNGNREDLPENLPRGCKELIQQCWDANPLKRPRAVDLVQMLDQIKLEEPTHPRPVSPSGEALYNSAVIEHKAGRLYEAHQLYEGAANKHYAKALTNLGLFALDGTGGQPVDKLRAKTLLEQAAAAGHARAMFNLGRMHERGDGIAVNLPEALAWYRKAYEADPQDQRAKAKMELLGRLLAPQSATGGYAQFSRP